MSHLCGKISRTTAALALLALGCTSGPQGPNGGPPGTGSGGLGAPVGSGGAGPAAGSGGAGPSPGSGGGTATGGAPGSGTGGAPGSGTGGAAVNPTLIGAVAFSTPSQSFKGMLSVGMTTVIAGAEIRYTTDGTVPTASSPLYGGTALNLTATTQLRAQPFSGGAAAGTLSTAIYIARTFDLSSKLPIMILDGYGKGASTDKDVTKDAAVMIWEPVAGTAVLTALPTIASRAGYHLRGQSSANFPQKPYKVELWDNANADAKYAVLGMPADADWALIAPYYDRALIRNPFIYTLGKDMGLEAPRTQYVEVYINHAARAVAETDYQGIYWLTETIENNGHRVNLKELKPDDTTAPAVSGGYIFKFDQAAAEEPKLMCTGSNAISGGLGGGMAGGGTCWTDLEVVDPEPLGAEQKTWLTQHIQTFHNLLHTNPIGDYASVIDVPSFVDYLIVNELSRNVDAYVRSAYYHKDRDAKLKAGPLWDYNFSLAVGGANTVAPAPATNGFQFQGSRNVNNWYPRLTSDPAFMTQVKARYKALRANLLSQASIDSRIAMLRTPLDTASVARDYAKWPVSSVLPNGRNGIVSGPAVPTWDEQVQAMQTFITARLAWMDMQLQ